MENHDAIKHPKHYCEGRKYEPKDVIRNWGLNFNLGNAVKYIARAGRKDDIVQELKKAQEYIQFEIDAIEAERKDEAPKEAVEPKGVKFGSFVVPAGTPVEDIITMIFDKVYGNEE